MVRNEGSVWRAGEGREARRVACKSIEVGPGARASRPQPAVRGDDVGSAIESALPYVLHARWYANLRLLTMFPYDDYLRIAADWEAEFARNQRRYGEKIHCRKGCSDCCSQMFQITELEAAYISRAVKELPPDARGRMKQRA